MREYKSGKWGFGLIWSLRGSVFPRASAVAFPNAIFTFLVAYAVELQVGGTYDNPDRDIHRIPSKDAAALWAGFTTVLFFVLSFRSNIAYNRWWEGGTLLQQTRGEWFNAYSSLIAFTATTQEMDKKVVEYQHMLARFMSMLYCFALQQVSPDQNRPFEIIDPRGIDPESLAFLHQSSDKVEVVLQWIQRSTIVNMQAGVLTAPPPVMSRAFQELSRGIVNLQNARKIADFPFPYPYAQTSIVMLMTHWVMCPVLASIVLDKFLATITCFCVVFFIWCINYIALDLEMPFGSDSNDLPMKQMQADWNKSIMTLTAKRANTPPSWAYDPSRGFELRLSDGSVAPRRATVTALMSKLMADESFALQHKAVPNGVKIDAAAARPVATSVAAAAAKPTNAKVTVAPSVMPTAMGIAHSDASNSSGDVSNSKKAKARRRAGSCCGKGCRGTSVSPTRSSTGVGCEGASSGADLGPDVNVGSAQAVAIGKDLHDIDIGLSGGTREQRDASEVNQAPSVTTSILIARTSAQADRGVVEPRGSIVRTSALRAMHSRVAEASDAAGTGSAVSSSAPAPTQSPRQGGIAAPSASTSLQETEVRAGRQHVAAAPADSSRIPSTSADRSSLGAEDRPLVRPGSVASGTGPRWPGAAHRCFLPCSGLRVAPPASPRRGGSQGGLSTD